MEEINRVAAVLKPTPLMVAWINQHGVESPQTLSLQEARLDCTVLLLPTFSEESDAEAYLTSICHELFANELAMWNEDETTWPSDRTIDIFLSWFDMEFHSDVFDAGEILELEEDEDDDEEDMISDTSRVLQ